MPDNRLVVRATELKRIGTFVQDFIGLEYVMETINRIDL